ncbi:MAG: hypothetical protein ABI239_03285 [Aquihabitans sp.]
MSSTSFRDRFFSPPVAHALTSPSGILAAGAGAAVGIVVTAPVSIPLAVAGGIVGAVVGLGGRVLAAVPRKETGPRIDPFAVNEPWRHSVIDALQAQVRFTQAVKSFRAGPLKDTLVQVGVQIDDAVRQCWEVAQQGQLIAAARRDIDDFGARTELTRIQAGRPDQGGQASDVRTRTIEALQSQIATADRLDALLAGTNDRLDLLNARLDESVTRALELSVTNRTSDANALGSDVGRIVDDLESLRVAIEDLDHRDPKDTTLPEPSPSSDQSATPDDPETRRQGSSGA